MLRLIGLGITLVTLGACADDGGTVTSASASGSASRPRSGSASFHVDIPPLPAGCQLEQAIVAPTNGSLVVHLRDDGLTVSSDTVAAGTIEITAANDGSRPHELAVERSGTIVARIVASEPSVDCVGRFELRPGDYTLVADTGTAALRVTPTRRSA